MWKWHEMAPFHQAKLVCPVVLNRRVMENGEKKLLQWLIIIFPYFSPFKLLPSDYLTVRHGKWP